MKIAILIVKFFVLGALFIVSNYSLALKDPSQFAIFSELYLNWLESFFNNSMQVTGYVVQFDWLPRANETIPNFLNR